MKRYRVSVRNADGTDGIGEMIVTATSEEEAKVIFAEGNGTTVDYLLSVGDTEWTVEEVA